MDKRHLDIDSTPGESFVPDLKFVPDLPNHHAPDAGIELLPVKPDLHELSVIEASQSVFGLVPYNEGPLREWFCYL